MKKKIVLLCIGLLVFCTPQALAANLLSNPDFENGVISGWTNGGPNWVAENIIVYNGNYAAKNTIGSLPNQSYFSRIYQDISASAGQTFYATLQVKTDINIKATATAGLLVEFLNSNSQVIESKSDIIGGLTDWRYLYVAVQAPSGTVKVRYSCFVFAPQDETGPGGVARDGKAYYDEAVLDTNYIPPPPDQKEMINAGFENGLNDWLVVYLDSFDIDDAIYYEGLVSAKNTIGLITGQDFFSGAYQDIVYDPGMGTQVYGSAQVTTAINPSSTGIAGFKLEFYDSLNVLIGSSEKSLNGYNPWTRLVLDGSGSGITPPVGTVTIRVLVFTYAIQGDTQAVGGTANFDDVIFSYDPLPPNYRTSILNADFENGLSSWSNLYGFPAEITSTVVHGGLLAAKKTVEVVADQDYYSQLLQDIYFDNQATPYPTNTPVYATAYGKTDMNPETKSQIGLQMEFIDSQGKVIEDAQGKPIVYTDVIGGQTDWRQLYINAETPAGTVRTRVSGFVFAREAEAPVGGVGYYDDFDFDLGTFNPPLISELRNPGFENGLNDWTEEFWPGEVDPIIKFSGQYSASFEITQPSPTENYFGVASQIVDIDGAGMVTAKGMVKTEISPGSLAAGGLYVAFLDEDNVQIGPIYSKYISGITDWTQLKVRKRSPKNTKKVKFVFFLYGLAGSTQTGDKAYFDDGFLKFNKLHLAGPILKLP